MKFFISLFVMVSFLPYQAGAGCSMELEIEASQPSCHSMNQSTVSKGHSSELNLVSQSLSCSICQLGLCAIYDSSKKSMAINIGKVSKKVMNYASNGFLLPGLLPLKIFYDPPPSGAGNASKLSYDTWQSYYSVFLI